jgi:hypothetical protein
MKWFFIQYPQQQKVLSFNLFHVVFAKDSQKLVKLWQTPNA